MAYLVLARKYRPQSFDDVIGQRDIAEKLTAALASGRAGHAYLFCGPRGTGKTTCARILARELNRVATPAAGMLDLGIPSSLDIIEIDGASNNGVDDIRTLRDNVAVASMSGGVKVYIIDEVHMLSAGAFNALLKTLEEPPSHVKFILATTDPAKVPLTVISRCQRFDFKRIPLDQIASRLRDICLRESFTADEEALAAVARAAQGSMRDALSILDQLGASGPGNIDRSAVDHLLGHAGNDQLLTVAAALLNADCAAAFRGLETIAASGKDLRQFGLDLTSMFRDLMVMKVGGKDLQDLIETTAAGKKALYDIAAPATLPAILAAMDHLVAAQDTLRLTAMPRLALEIAFARIIAPAVRPEIPPARPAAPILQNNRGAVSIAPLPGKADVPPLIPAIPAPAADSRPLGLEDILKEWNALTGLVARKRISIGTYLLEGTPTAYCTGKLTVAFPPPCGFHREFLARPDSLRTIDEAFRETFNTPCTVEFICAEQQTVRQPPAPLSEALAMFGGEVINEWHPEEAPDPCTPLSSKP